MFIKFNVPYVIETFVKLKHEVPHFSLNGIQVLSVMLIAKLKTT